MNKAKSFLILTAIIFSTFSILQAEEAKDQHMPMPAPVMSKEFEQLKKLVGVWEGDSPDSKQERKITAEYQLTSGGSAIIEKLFSGTPKEMVTIYYDQGGKLAMMHYCMLGNRPQMNLVSSDEKSLKFDLNDKSDIDAAKETHMHSLVLTMTDDKHLTEDWALYEAGKETGVHTFNLTRLY